LVSATFSCSSANGAGFRFWQVDAKALAGGEGRRPFAVGDEMMGHALGASTSTQETYLPAIDELGDRTHDRQRLMSVQGGRGRSGKTLRSEV